MTSSRVLVIDDHFIFAQAIAMAIKELPRYELIGIAVTGPQALAMAREHRPDVVLLDFHLPGYSADSLIPRLREAAPEARVVVLTSDVSERAMAASLDAGADVFITKDKAIEDVFAALDQHRSSNRTTVAPPIARPDEAAERPAAEPVPMSGTTAGAESVLLRVAGAATFARAAVLEDFLATLPLVRAVHIREIEGQLSTFRVLLAEGHAVDDLASALNDAPIALDLGARGEDTLDVVARGTTRG